MERPIITLCPIGGLGQIGSNMFQIDFKETSILIDAGILFPQEDVFDIEYLIPDFSSIKSPVNLIITHAHEDHIGAISHVLEKFPDLEIMATPFAKKLIEKKLSALQMGAKIKTIYPNTEIKIEELSIYPLLMNHSTPETLAIFLKQENGHGILFASDFCGPIFPETEKKIKQLSCGLQHKILLADSTNILHKKDDVLEDEVFYSLEKIFQENTSTERFFITLFASNITRLKSIITLAKKFNKKILPYGPAIRNYITIAQECGLLDDGFRFKDPEEIEKDEKNIIVLLSGCQGDFRGTFRRFARKEDSLFSPKSTDIFIYSAKAIPGNEKKVMTLLNYLAKENVQVITPSTHTVHASGHASQEYVKYLYKIFNPTISIPIHGESYFLQQHRNFINQNFPQTKVEVLHNFDSINFYNDNSYKLFFIEHEPLPTIIHKNRLPIERPALAERRKMAQGGIIVISINASSVGKGNPEIFVSFLGQSDVTNKKYDPFCLFIKQYLKSNKIKEKEKEKDIEKLRIVARQFITSFTGQKPVVLIHYH